MKLPTFYIPHGGGPCFDLEWPNGNPWAGLRDYLAAFAPRVGAHPRAILVVSAHWETGIPTVTGAATPDLIYDYTGFPPHTYALRYDAPGSPEIAARVRDLLAAAKIESATNPDRGLDHGVFVPFRVMYPDADVPVVQLSIQRGYDPARHFAVGAALEPLRDEGVLIVGSGMSQHNFATMRDGVRTDAERFDGWLGDAMTGDPSRRAELLERWASAPSARAAHPEEDHLVPLFVAAGAGGDDPGTRDFHGDVANKPLSGFRFG